MNEMRDFFCTIFILILVISSMIIYEYRLATTKASGSNWSCDFGYNVQPTVSSLQA